MLQELVALDEIELHYWDPDTGHAELDFVLQADGRIIPLEVKAEQNLKAKSLKSFADKYHPERLFRTSLSPYFKGENVTDVPLYAVSRIPSLNQ